jgi:hypothetical protein
VSSGGRNEASLGDPAAGDGADPHAAQPAQGQVRHVHVEHDRPIDSAHCAQPLDDRGAVAAAVVDGRHHHDVVAVFVKGGGELLEATSMDAVVVGHQHSHVSLPLSRLARPEAVSDHKRSRWRQVDREMAGGSRTGETSVTSRRTLRSFGHPT